MRPTTQHFIENNIHLIENNEFAVLYRHARDFTPDLSIQDLTLTLQDADITPLKHMTYVPEQYLLQCARSLAPTIELPHHLNHIYERAFEETDLKFIVIPEGVQHIETRAFAWCEDLETISLPSSLDRMGRLLFVGCRSLKEIHFNGTLARWAKIDKPVNWFSTNRDHARQVKVICRNGETCAE